MKTGQRLFANYCSQCHGADAQGSFGFPNLADHDWLYGDAPEQIEHSIASGRSGVMPGWEAALGNDGIRQVAAHVLALGGREVKVESESDDAEAGAKSFAMFCAACHRSEEHTSELQSRENLVCRLLLEKKK